MKVIIFIMMLFLANCGKPKTVLICGDHVCVNKDEAEQYFEENLTIEVEIIKKKNKKKIDLVELNLENNQKGKKKVNIFAKDKTDKDLKTLSNKEKIKIKDKVKRKKIASKKIKEKITISNKSDKTVSKSKKKNIEKISDSLSKTNKRNDNIIDVCEILEKCNIKEISKYLLNEGKNKDFPDIRLRQ